MELVGTDENEFPGPVRLCLDSDEKLDIISCSDASNYAKYIKAPLLII